MDWGTAPAWAAIVVAVVAGWFAYRNVATAQRAYADNSWDRKVNVARLVYVDVLNFADVEEGADRPYFKPTEVTFGDAYFKARNVNGIVSECALTDVTGFHVLLVNNSDEPVGNPILVAQSGDWLESEIVSIPTLKPKSETLAVVWFMRAWDTSGFISLTMSFTDSAGHSWSREGTNPPVEVDPEVKKKWLRKS